MNKEYLSKYVDKVAINKLHTYYRYYCVQNKLADLAILSFIVMNTILVPVAIFIPNIYACSFWLCLTISNIVYLFFIKKNMDTEKLWIISKFSLNVWIKLFDKVMKRKSKKVEEDIDKFLSDLNNQRKLMLPICDIYYKSSLKYSLIDSLLNDLEQKQFEQFCQDYEKVDALIERSLQNKGHSTKEVHPYYYYLKTEKMKTKLENELTIKEEPSVVIKRNKI